MKLVVDAVGNKNGGGATVLLDTLRAILANDSFREVTLLASPAPVRQFDLPHSEKLRIVDIVTAEGPFGRVFWALRGLDRQLEVLQPDLFLGLNGMGSMQKQFPSFVFIQQSLPYSREALLRCSHAKRLRMAVIAWVTRRSARAAAHVFVQSEAMRETISKAFGIGPQHISAFMPGAPGMSAPASRSPKVAPMTSDSKRGTILFVGSDEPHKNVEVLRQGLRCLPESKRPTLYVTLPKTHSICRDGEAISLGRLDRAELYEAYQSATILVMPSLVETVGLPMLEAMRVGVPILAADRPYAHEVCENAAVYFDPLSPEDFAKKAGQLLEDPQQRARLVELGAAVVKRREGIDPYRRMLEKMLQVAQVAPQHNERKTAIRCCDCQTKTNTHA